MIFMKIDYDKIMDSIDHSLPLDEQLNILYEKIHLASMEVERQKELIRKRKKQEKQEREKKQERENQIIEKFNLDEICNLLHIIAETDDIRYVSLPSIEINNKKYNIEKKHNILTIRCSDSRCLRLSVNLSTWEEEDWNIVYTAYKYLIKFSYNEPNIRFENDRCYYITKKELANSRITFYGSRVNTNKDIDPSIYENTFTKEELVLFTKELATEIKTLRENIEKDSMSRKVCK